jgi:putative holliday junction resolvase
MVGRVLGIDLGEKRIGLALSDPLGMIASPLGKIEFKGEDNLVAEIEKVVKEKQVAELVVGHPIRTSGKQGEQALAAEKFAGLLRERLKLPVHLVDERMTTAGAEKALLESDMSRGKRREVRDQVAASLILQSFLERNRQGR